MPGTEARPEPGRRAAPTELGLIAAVVLSVWLAIGGVVQAETRTGEARGYRYRLFVPEAPDMPPLPLVVAIHGCKQSAKDMTQLSRFNDLAAAAGFAVLYPETGPSADNRYGCWRWWVPENQIRAGSEAEIIVTMVSEAGSTTKIDRQRVYAVGFSSGGALSALLGALYPEIFAAVGVHSGLPYAAASTGACALRAMSDGALSSESRAAVAYNAQGRKHRVMPLVVVHGDEDKVVAAENARLLVRQYAELNDLADDGNGDNRSVDAVADSERKDQIADGKAYRIRGYQDGRGEEIMREVIVAGMGHAWSGGPSEVAFSDPKGPDATLLFWSFFRHRTLADTPLSTRLPSRCRERFGANFSHYMWHGRMSEQEYRCDRWGWTWRRGFDGQWTGGRCP